jgi:mono/diheme cytochrome c family protein
VGKCYSSAVINAPAERVWATMRNFHDLIWATGVVTKANVAGNPKGDRIRRLKEESVKLGSLVCVVTIALAICCTAQEGQKEVKQEPMQPAPTASGKEMFRTYCASCHGKDAKGGGPAAAALKTAPPDLTTLAKRNGGKFPKEQVAGILRGQASPAAHGDPEMPVWGLVFWRASHGHDGDVQRKIAKLIRYLESLQVK